MPDENTKEVRIYVMNIINTLTGGEFDQFIKELELAILKSRQSISKKQKDDEFLGQIEMTEEL